VTGIWQDPTSGVIVIVGTFTHVNGVSRVGFAIFDSSLNLLPRVYAFGLGAGNITSVAFDSSSNIYVAGTFHGVDGLGDSFYDSSAYKGMYMGIVQLSTDGGMSNGYVYTPSVFFPPVFTTGGEKGVFGNSGGTAIIGCYSVLQDPATSNLLVTGDLVNTASGFQQYGSTACTGLITISNNGTLVTVYSGATSGLGFCISDGSGGWYGTEFGTYVWHGDFAGGTTANPLTAGSTTLSPLAGLNQVAMQGSDVILVGFFNASTGPTNSQHDVLRFVGGVVDTGFGAWGNPGGFYGSGSHPSGVSVDSSGNVYCFGIASSFVAYGGVSCNDYLVRLTSVGALDTGWTADTNGIVSALLPLASGSILTGGSFTQSGPHGSLTAGNYLTLFDGGGTKLW
jgi:hypothetical protein